MTNRKRGHDDTASRRDRKRDRRAEIISALYRAMVHRGFSGTSITDLAKGAGMTVSHLLYYFSSKEEVLAALSQETIGRTLEAMEASRGSRPEEQCRALADFNFGGPGSSPIYKTLALELMAASVYDKRLLRLSRQTARAYRDHLREIFRNSPGNGGFSADDAALIAGSLWMGLFVNSRFQSELTRKRAHRLFLRTILQLAGLTNTRSSPGTGARRTKEGQ